MSFLDPGCIIVLRSVPYWRKHGARVFSIQCNLFVFDFLFHSCLVVLGICLHVGGYMGRGLIRSNIIRLGIEFRLDSLSLSTIISLPRKLTELDFNVSLTA